MNLEKFYNLDGARLSFTRQQASDFAKSVAGDFNILHDVDSKRFCVPVICCSPSLSITMVCARPWDFPFPEWLVTRFRLFSPKVNAREISIYDENDKKYLDVSSDGAHSSNPKLINSLTRNYVAFSGDTFPHVLVPLMQENNLMINTERPLIIYDHMRISLDTLDIDSVELRMTDSKFRLYGKRGDVALNYDISCNGEVVGRGQKKMVLSGLREYDQGKIDALIESFDDLKSRYANHSQ